MSKKKETEIVIFGKNISKKAKELGFKEIKGTTFFEYDLPFGENTSLIYDSSDLKISICIMFEKLINIRKIESPEDLEMLFNAICPEKYRLPFS